MLSQTTSQTEKLSSSCLTSLLFAFSHCQLKGCKHTEFFITPTKKGSATGITVYAVEPSSEKCNTIILWAQAIRHSNILHNGWLSIVRK